MNTFAKILAPVLILAYTASSSYAAYDVVSCDSSADFTANSCNECFVWGEVIQWDNKGLLTDVWTNTSDASQVLFKEEQELPQVIGLNGATWTEVKASESVDFWQYTVDLDALYDEEQLGYALTAGSEVTWIESTLGSAYQLTSNTAAAGENVGIIAYDIATHQVQDGGELTVDADVHRECVMFTSAEGDTPVTPPTTPTPPTELPQTGPEHILLALAALLLGFGFLKFRRKA